MDEMLRRRLMMQPRGGGGHNLPPEYQEVEWLENLYNASSRAAFISTVITPGAATKLKIKARVRVPSAIIVRSGSCWSGANNGQFFGYTNGNWGGNANPSKVPVNTDVWVDIEYTSEIIDNVDYISMKVNGTQVWNTTYSRGSFNQNIHCIFNIGNNFTPYHGGYCFVGDICTDELYLDDVLVFNGVACYRKSDNVGGFYDLVARKFNPNVTSNPFIFGPDVN